MSIKTYRDLDAWRAGMDVVEEVYKLTKRFPADERFGLKSQLRRAAVSLPLNVAEGATRRTPAALVNHVSIALGSHAELETCLEIALRLGYLSGADAQHIAPFVERAGQLLNGLRRSLVSKRDQRASNE